MVKREKEKEKEKEESFLKERKKEIMNESNIFSVFLFFFLLFLFS